MIRLNYTKKSGKLKGKRNDSGVRYLEYMSYSRWSNSFFYTYWCSSMAERKEDELFACHVDLVTQTMITYEECIRIVDSLILIKGKINQIENDEEASELQGYIKNFIGDVDHKYLTKIRGGQ